MNVVEYEDRGFDLMDSLIRIEKENAMPNRWKEREQAIMNGLMSLVINECDALECLKKQGTEALYEGIACKVRPTLHVCAGEAHQLRADRNTASRQAEAWRQALEYIASNAKSASPAHIQAYAERALGRGQ